MYKIAEALNLEGIETPGVYIATREKQEQRLALAENHLLNMEKSYERINKDLRDAYESYKLGMTDRETYLE